MHTLHCKSARLLREYIRIVVMSTTKRKSRRYVVLNHIYIKSEHSEHCWESNRPFACDVNRVRMWCRTASLVYKLNMLSTANWQCSLKARRRWWTKLMSMFNSYRLYMAIKPIAVAYFQSSLYSGLSLCTPKWLPHAQITGGQSPPCKRSIALWSEPALH